MTRDTPRPKRSGRRPGRPDTRGAILDAARASFAARGFAASTVRAIAADAGCDPALIHHYFGTKDQLFLATVSLPVDPRSIVGEILDSPRNELGLRLVRTVLGVWESPANDAIVAVIRGAISDPAIGTAVQEYLSTQVVARVLAAVDCDPDERPVRGALVASQMIGVLLGRHVLKIEPLASAPVSALIPSIAATVQHYLTGPLAAGDASGRYRSTDSSQSRTSRRPSRSSHPAG